MAYQNNGQKKVYPFNYRSFALQLNGEMVSGCSRTPTMVMSPGKECIYANGYFNHESMKEGFGQKFSYDEFNIFLDNLEEMVNDPSEGELTRAMKFTYFKDGKHNFNGVTLGLVRDKNGLMYFAFKSNKIPTIRFPLTAAPKLLLVDKDGVELDIRTSSRIFTKSWIRRQRNMAQRALDNAIEDTPNTNDSQGATKSNTGDAPTSSMFADNDDTPFG